MRKIEGITYNDGIFYGNMTMAYNFYKIANPPRCTIDEKYRIKNTDNNGWWYPKQRCYKCHKDDVPLYEMCEWCYDGILC